MGLLRPRIFVVDLLNFSFWLPGHADTSFSITWNGERHRGYFALCACINRALAVCPVMSPLGMEGVAG